MRLRLAASRLLALFRKRRLDGELEGEIRAHLEMAELDAISTGLSPEEARHAARRGFGGIEPMKEDHRDQRSVRWMNTPTILCRSPSSVSSRFRTPGSPANCVCVSALDPAALAVACVLMTLVGILAALIPASRAAGVDPMTVLRDEG